MKIQQKVPFTFGKVYNGVSYRYNTAWMCAAEVGFRKSIDLLSKRCLGVQDIKYQPLNSIGAIIVYTQI